MWTSGVAESLGSVSNANSDVSELLLFWSELRGAGSTSQRRIRLSRICTNSISQSGERNLPAQIRFNSSFRCSTFWLGSIQRDTLTAPLSVVSSKAKNSVTVKQDLEGGKGKARYRNGSNVTDTLRNAETNKSKGKFKIKFICTWIPCRKLDKPVSTCTGLETDRRWRNHSAFCILATLRQQQRRLVFRLIRQVLSTVWIWHDSNPKKERNNKDLLLLTGL